LVFKPHINTVVGNVNNLIYEITDRIYVGTIELFDCDDSVLKYDLSIEDSEGN